MVSQITTTTFEPARKPSRPRLRVLCAWCEGAPRLLAEQPVSHGICRECAVRFFGIDPGEPLTP